MRKGDDEYGLDMRCVGGGGGVEGLGRRRDGGGVMEKG